MHCLFPFSLSSKVLSSTKIKRKKKMDALNPQKLIKTACWCVRNELRVCKRFPYDVPEFMPQILMDLSDHLDDPPTHPGIALFAYADFFI